MCRREGALAYHIPIATEQICAIDSLLLRLVVSSLLDPRLQARAWSEIAKSGQSTPMAFWGNRWRAPANFD